MYAGQLAPCGLLSLVYIYTAIRSLHDKAEFCHGLTFLFQEFNQLTSAVVSTVSVFLFRVVLIFVWMYVLWCTLATNFIYSLYTYTLYTVISLFCYIPCISVTKLLSARLCCSCDTAGLSQVI